MIERYTRPEMGAIWNLENKYRQWLEVELAASDALAELGEVPKEAAEQLRKNAGFQVDRILEIESVVKHDVIAFTTAVAETMEKAGAADSSRWLHYGLTSNDVVDTAQALQIKQASELILKRVDELIGILKDRAHEFQHAIQVGRSHGVHAEPITFGLKVAIWYDELVRNRKRFADAAEEIRVGKTSGAVGTFGHIGPEAEDLICEKLGLRAAPITNQVISRDCHAAYMAAMGLITATLEKIALEVRHLQRTEVREAEEPFAKGQKGSSAMPHKRNPIVCEQICGLARIVRSNVQAAYENIALWHERDISHSSVERVILPDSTILTDYLLAKSIWLVKGMRVDTKRMKKNLDLTGGLIFSGQLLLDLTAAGMLREKAYKLVQEQAMKAWLEDANFREEIESNPEIKELLSPEQIAKSFSADRQLKNVDRIFERVFADKQ